MTEIETPKYTEENLSEMELPKMYDILYEQVGDFYESEEERLKEKTKIKGILLRLVLRAYFKTLFTSKDSPKMREKFLAVEKWFLEKINVEPEMIIDEELQKLIGTDDMERKGLVVYTNHHGGGAETFFSRTILNKIKKAPLRWALKDGLMKIPLYKSIIKKSKPIVIERKKPGEKRAETIEKLKKYGRQIAEALKNKETVVIAFEGTRSRDGEITENPKYDGVANALDKYTREAIKKSSEDPKDYEYNKALMVVDTFTALPEAPEKNFFSKKGPKTGMKGGMRAHLSLLPDELSLKPPKYPAPILKLSKEKNRQKHPIKPSEENPLKMIKFRMNEREEKVKEIREQTDNIFGYVRTKLKKILTARILEHKEKEKA